MKPTKGTILTWIAMGIGFLGTLISGVAESQTIKEEVAEQLEEKIIEEENK